MLSRQVGRACYSTNITQDFINDLLMRAKEATTHSAAARKHNNNNNNVNNARKGSENRNPNFNRNRNNNGGKFAQSRQSRGRPFNNRRNNNNGKSSDKNRAIGQTMTNSNVKSDITLNQPQFANKKVAGTESVDFINIIQDPTKIKANSRQSFNQSKRDQRGKRSQNRSNLPRQYQDKIPIKRQVVSEEYYPEDNTPASLLKYSSDLFHTQGSRSQSFAVKILKDSNFPINRGPTISSSLKYSPLSFNESFGKYMPAHSLILQREPQLKNLDVYIDNPNYLNVVKGKYTAPPVLSTKDFETVSSNKTTQENLLKHSKLVGTALQNDVHLNRDPTKFNVLFEVCSGLKPISELMK
ncbi:hypothetical protein C6P45_002920 [Maudiozyma exigua]|uniref:Uncharacterized protein n=1 Tax=Maudiozyma exigua TaxID=34358 RepID=A0A9P7B2Z1_MAUEX|nr:hypothetical protein C6P45_002920 [Kazachstania exigua]